MFHGLRAPPISIEAYLVRIAKYAKCSPACFAHSMVHMLKLAQQDTSFAPTRLNVHRLVLTGVLISAKFLDDRYFNNAFYAKVGMGVGVVGCVGGTHSRRLPQPSGPWRQQHHCGARQLQRTRQWPGTAVNSRRRGSCTHIGFG